MINSKIQILNPNSEICREGFKPNDTVLAEIMLSGSAWFRGLNNWCVMYPGDYIIVPIL